MRSWKLAPTILLLAAILVHACSSTGQSGGPMGAGAAAGSGAGGNGVAPGTGDASGSVLPTGGAGAGVSRLSCPQTQTCIDACAATDDACSNACFGRGTPEAQSAFTALYDCATAELCTDAACLETSCSAELDACVGSKSPGAAGGPGGGGGASGSGGVAPGTKTCVEVSQCAANCAGDTPCYDGCLNSGTASARTTYDAYAVCYADALCTDLACAQSECAGDLRACLDDGPSSAGTGGSGGGHGGAGGGGGTGTPSTVPPELVGTWSDYGYRFQFLADGNANYERSSSTTDGRCTYTSNTTHRGIAAFNPDAKFFVLAVTDVTNDIWNCSPIKQTSMDPPKPLGFFYELVNPTTLVVTSTGDHCGQTTPEGIEQWCRKVLTKR